MIADPAVAIGSDTRLRELLLYVAHQSKDDPDFGEVKAHQIVFWADFIAYERWGVSISGQEYVKLDIGPCARDLSSAQNSLIEEGSVSVVSCGDESRQRRWVPLRKPILERFRSEELGAVDEAIERLRGFNCPLTSQYSRDFIGWQLAYYGETIPYETILIWDRELTDAEAQGGVECSEPSCTPAASCSNHIAPLRV